MKLDKKIELLTRDKYGGQANRGLARDLSRLREGEPLDYVIGWREFLGCRIDLSKRPLIPREETEFWVGEAIKAETGRRSRISDSFEKRLLKPAPTSLKVLDLFSGSGCIGLAVLKHVPNVKVTFADLHPINKRTIKTNIFSNIKGKFDIIFANPPYIPTKKSAVQKSVKDWEPKAALYAGEDGLMIIEKFLRQAKDHLNPNGHIYLEFGYGQKAKVEKLIKQFDYAHCRFHRDQFGRYRWVVIELT